MVVKCVGHSQAAAQSFGAVAALLQSIDHPHIAKVLHVEVLQGDDLARRVDGVQVGEPFLTGRMMVYSLAMQNDAVQIPHFHTNAAMDHFTLLHAAVTRWAATA